MSIESSYVSHSHILSPSDVSRSHPHLVFPVIYGEGDSILSGKEAYTVHSSLQQDPNDDIYLTHEYPRAPSSLERDSTLSQHQGETNHPHGHHAADDVSKMPSLVETINDLLLRFGFPSPLKIQCASSGDESAVCQCLLQLLQTHQVVEIDKADWMSVATHRDASRVGE